MYKSVYDNLFFPECRPVKSRISKKKKINKDSNDFLNSSYLPIVLLNSNILNLRG